jgi:excisionase family DNA binding protein
VNGKLTVTVREASILLGVSEGVVRSSIRAKTIPSLRLGMRRVVIPVAKLYALLGEHAGIPQTDATLRDDRA